MSVRPEGLRHLRAIIVGAGREGVALARYLVWCGAHVRVSDAKPAAALGERPAQLAALGVPLALDCALPDLDAADVLFVSPGVPFTAPVVQAARARGLPIASEPRLFTQLCSAPIVGVTGSSGKTTTASLPAAMCAADGRTVWLGGNIGTPLIERLMADERPDLAVMELSSFQLELFAPGYQGSAVATCRSAASRAVATTGWSPHVAAITNITPNHLDRHASMADYTRAKAQILLHQRADDWVVLNRDDSGARSLAPQVRGRLLWFSLEQSVAQGSFLDGDTLRLRTGEREVAICRRRALHLRGRHNVANVLAAACCAWAAGAPAEAIGEAAAAFEGVPHRLEEVRTWRGALFVNDSIATSPERAMAAISAFDEPLILLAGGRDKHLPWDTWARLVQQRVRLVIAFGEAAPLIEHALRATAGAVVLRRAADLPDAVSVAAEAVRAGEVVLLSPGGTSYDAYVDYEERGRDFQRLVAALPEEG